MSNPPAVPTYKGVYMKAIIKRTVRYAYEYGFIDILSIFAIATVTNRLLKVETAEKAIYAGFFVWILTYARRTYIGVQEIKKRLNIV